MAVSAPLSMIEHQCVCVMQNEPAFFRELLPIPHILAGVRAHFWETPSPDSLKQAYGGDLTLAELRGVRRGLLQVVLVFMQALAAQQNSLGIDDVQVSCYMGFHVSA